ncbi:hypothetical protein S40285_10851 [Stachybotrys chlorohalonatus IBT 40285]|uniref:Uncharacterized protein n=1 Tax=Stachybotrys chlorohalonatus (strain IBT 40285) TaxID=1283841 RepID=A0A084QV87_STAC4|nr:hypothetical protein S40285_10851 [Stachybotrys chlorohalonata IBT 40285]
MRPSLAFLSPP